MESLVEAKIAKVHILSILDCYCRLFPLIYISYDSEGITIQGSCKERRVLATTIILQDSLESYECKESMVLVGELRMYLSRVTEFHMKLLVAICII